MKHSRQSHESDKHHYDNTTVAKDFFDTRTLDT